MIEIDTNDKNILLDLFKGHQLYFVGGYVRDKMRGEDSDDIDFATDMNPFEMISECVKKGIKYWHTENSIRHGTITILDKYEVTTFRKDVATDGRNATIEFAKTIEDDLSRRDFTINAMSMCFFTGKLIDPFNGMDDLKKGIIRAVGNPKDRLKEDTLRALRAIRFANRFGFEIEIELLKAINDTDISNISVERIRDEFMKILKTRNDNYINFILYKVIPELKVIDGLNGGNRHGETVDIHSVTTMKNMMRVSDNPLDFFIALNHDIGKGYTFNNPERMFKGHEDIGADKIKEIMERMKFSNDETEYAYTMIKNHMRWHFDNGSYKDTTEKAIKRAIRDLPDKFDKEKMIKDLCLFAWADNQSNSYNIIFGTKTLEEYTSEKKIYVRALDIIRKKYVVKVGSGLEINGHDLIEMGFKPGVIFNTILKDVEEKVFNEELKNDKEELKKYVMDKYAKM